MEFVSTREAPAPGGHYSQAVAVGGQVWVSGILPIPKEGLPESDGFEEQTARVLAHFDGVLKGAGVKRNDVVQVRIYVTDIAHWPAFDAAYVAFFGDHKPARAVVPVPELHYGFKLELEAMAVK